MAKNYKGGFENGKNEKQNQQNGIARQSGVI